MNNTFKRMLFAYSNKNAMIYHINAITRIGASCNCSCIKCGKPVTACKTSNNTDGFIHQDGSDSCILTELDVDLHKMVCTIFKDLKYIKLPAVDTHYRKNIIPEEFFYIEECYIEQQEDDIRPDILLKNKEGRIIRVEIFITHKVEEAKKDKLRKNHKETIEIDLSEYSINSIPADFIDIIQNQVTNKYWLYNKDQAYIEDHIFGNYKILTMNHNEEMQGVYEGCWLHMRQNNYGSKEGKLAYYACKSDCDKCLSCGNNLNLPYNGRLTNNLNEFVVCFQYIQDLNDFEISLEDRKQKYSKLIGAKYQHCIKDGICQTCGEKLKLYTGYGKYFLGCPNYATNNKCKKSKVSNSSHIAYLGYSIEEREDFSQLKHELETCKLL